MLNLQRLSVELQNGYSTINKLSRKLIKKFYFSISETNNSSNELFEYWKKEFKFIYGDIEGNVSSNRKINPLELAEIYEIYLEKGEELNVNELFMSIQTYLSLVVRLVAYRLIKSVKNNQIESSNFKEFLQEVMNGDYFNEQGIKNYCYEDTFSWFLHQWDDEMESYITELYDELMEYNTSNNMREFMDSHNNDYIKQIYETIIPRELRHALGEYYTPDWLAEFTIEKTLNLSSQDVFNTRFLDPTCGSGTFLFRLLHKVKQSNKSILNITKQVVGFDINPLAVLTAKTNYLISILDILKEDSQIILPIYNYDVINSPIQKGNYLEIDINNDFIYKIPMDWILERKYKEYLDNVALAENPFKEDEDFSILYRQLNDHSSEVMKILVNIIINRIEGYLEEKVDIIVGNPPWVNWEYLPQEYRLKSAHLWKDYGIFSVKGRDLSFSKEDISVLITYLVIDKYLVEYGVLGFVIRQGLFKSSQNGIGFRKFKVREDGYDLKVLRVDDLSKIKPFENATNSTAILFMQRNRKNVYPVPYYMWSKKRTSNRATIGSYLDLNEILSYVEIEKMMAKPAIKDDDTSLWITAKESTLDVIQTVLGDNDYRARTGVFTGGANAVYWLDVKEKIDDNVVRVSNLTARAKRKVEDVITDIEMDYVYPLVQGSDLNQWQVNTKAYILAPHTENTKMYPIPEETLKEKNPLTYKYLLHFKDDLDSRRGFAGWEKEIQKEYFYSILRIGEYTYSKYKVAWRYIASDFITAVFGEIDDPYLGRKMLLPNEKVMYISTDNEQEAYYLCGILSSLPIRICVKSYMNPTSISTHVLQKLKIPTFDMGNDIHVSISNLCKLGHQTDDEEKRKILLREINLLVSDLYSIDKSKMEMLVERYG